MTAPALNRQGPAQELTDDQLLAAGLIEESVAEFDRPGDREGAMTEWTSAGGVQFKTTGLDTTDVVIYKITGQPVVQKIDLAIERLKKRYGPRDPLYPNQPVFYKRPPVAAPVPTLPCPLVAEGRCPSSKMLFNEEQVENHFRNRHKDDWDRRKRLRAHSQQERLIASQERTADLMAKLLAQGVPEATIAQVTAAAEPVAEAPFDINTASRRELMKHAGEYGINGKAAFGMSAAELRDAMRTAAQPAPEVSDLDIEELD
jgi:hypothetical protein